MKTINIYNEKGEKCGSFKLNEKEAERYAFAINTAGSLMIKGIQTNHNSLYAEIKDIK